MMERRERALRRGYRQLGEGATTFERHCDLAEVVGSAIDLQLWIYQLPRRIAVHTLGGSGIPACAYR